MWFNSIQREEPYLGLCTGRLAEMSSPARVGTQVLHGCRQLVSWDVGLSPATSATPAFSCQHSVGHSRWTAGVKPEEGGDDVKSSWPLCLGLHTCYNGNYRRMLNRKMVPILQKLSKFRLGSATRPHEGGIASNRGSERRGEYVPEPCTHRPSHHESRLYQKSLR